MRRVAIDSCRFIAIAPASRGVSGSRGVRLDRESGPELDRPVDEGIAHMVVTVRDEHIVEMKGCADRSVILRYAQSGG
jgi:hypothetical protein